MNVVSEKFYIAMLHILQSKSNDNQILESIYVLLCILEMAFIMSIFVLR